MASDEKLPQSIGVTQTVQQSARPSSPAPDGDAGYLLVIEDGSSLAVRLSGNAALVLGRATDVEVPLRSLSVSRRHARFSVGESGVTVEDLGSHNGTRRNGELLPANGSAILHPADVVTLCDVTVVYYGPQKPTPEKRQLLDGTSFRRQLATELERAGQSLRSLAVLVVRADKLAAEGRTRQLLSETLFGSERSPGLLRRMDSASLGARDELFILRPETDGEEAAETAARLLVALRELQAPRVGWATTEADGFDEGGLLGGARAAAEVAPEGQVRSAGDAVSTLRVGGETVLLADPAMVRLYGLIERLAQSELPVLVTGETGTGKELVAQALHERSPRKAQRLVSINCAALPDSLAESELFGHEKGAFTGATAAKAGLLETASGGTVFLDELGELSPAIQAKLLRVLETKRILRVGDNRERTIDIRLVAATHRSLPDEVSAGRFRKDLYFRLSSAVLVLPPLRDRRRELPILARAFLRAACKAQNKPEMTLSAGTLERLSSYSFPGNIRELKNAMQYAAATADEPVLEPWHLPTQIAGASSAGAVLQNLPTSALPSLSELATAALRLPVADKLAAVEAALVTAALKIADGNKSQAARLLGVHRKVIERRTTSSSDKP